MISQYVDKDHRTWDEHLPELQFAYNTAVHDATGYTPAYLNHGRELISPTEPEEKERTTEDPEGLRRKLQDAYTLVRINLAKAFQRQRRHYNLRRRAWKPEIGDWVLKKEHPLSKKADAFNSKLAPKYSGPYEIQKYVSPVIVDLKSKRGKWIRHVHIQDLKATENNNIPGENDPIPTDDESAEE